MDRDMFYTLKGYEMKESREISGCLEDYLEMLCRMKSETQPLRIKDLSERLHVRASSASKMAQILQQKGYLKTSAYHSLELTEKGAAYGSFLLYRHDVLIAFFQALNHSDHQLDLVEKIEHFMDAQTIARLCELTPALQKMPSGKE